MNRADELLIERLREMAGLDWTINAPQGITHSFPEAKGRWTAAADRIEELLHLAHNKPIKVADYCDSIAMAAMGYGKACEECETCLKRASL